MNKSTSRHGQAWQRCRGPRHGPSSSRPFRRDGGGGGLGPELGVVVGTTLTPLRWRRTPGHGEVGATGGSTWQLGGMMRE
jgi:hypothetical protein